MLITQYAQFYNSICQSRQAFSAVWPDKVPGKNSILNLANINGDSLSINMIAHLAINNGVRVNKSTCPLWLEQYNQDKKLLTFPHFKGPFTLDDLAKIEKSTLCCIDLYEVG